MTSPTYLPYKRRGILQSPDIAPPLSGDLPREFEHEREMASLYFFGMRPDADIDQAHCRECGGRGFRHEWHFAPDGRVLRLAVIDTYGGLLGYCWRRPNEG